MARRALYDALKRTVPAWAREMVPAAARRGVRDVLAGEAVPATPPVVAEPHFLEREHLARAAYDLQWQARFGNREGEARQYFVAHRERYYELLNALTHFVGLRAQGVRVLEVGVSEYTGLYRQFLPSIRLVTLDRPPEMQGADGAWCREGAGAEQHYSLDLNAAPPSPERGQPPHGFFL